MWPCLSQKRHWRPEWAHERMTLSCKIAMRFVFEPHRPVYMQYSTTDLGHRLEGYRCKLDTLVYTEAV